MYGFSPLLYVVITFSDYFGFIAASIVIYSIFSFLVVSSIVLIFLSDNRRGTCWTKMTAAGTCENSLGKLTLKSECCCSVGLAWGSPCEQCHIQECGCAKGYAKVYNNI